MAGNLQTNRHEIPEEIVHNTDGQVTVVIGPDAIHTFGWCRVVGIDDLDREDDLDLICAIEEREVPERQWKVSYLVRSRVLSADVHRSSVLVVADDAEIAASEAREIVRDKDIHCDPAIDPEVIVTDIEELA